MIPEIQKPNRKTYRLFDILTRMNDYWGTGEIPLTLGITVDNTQIATHGMIYTLWCKYTDFLYSQSDLRHFTAPNGDIVDGGYIVTEWELFVKRNGENLKRMIDALFSEYNPISNYDMIEVRGQGEKQDKITTTPHGTVTSTTTTQKTGLQSAGDGVQTDKITGETSYTNADTQNEFANTQSFDFDGETKTGFHKTLENYLKRSGNIGVTTSAQMIEQEIKIRQYTDLISDFVKRFIREYCYYVG